jgi:hypothetical protein
MSKTELIISVVVEAHGSEDHLNPFDRDSEIGQYYRNNVVVYSTSGVPDISALMSVNTAVEITNKIIQKFKDIPASDTRRIVNEFAQEFKEEYRNDVLKNGHKDKTGRIDEPMYISEISSVIAYLADKEYHFYPYVKGDEIVGITVTDVRQKITHPDRSISYNMIEFPAQVGQFNLIYKVGVEGFTEFLENKLGIGRDLSLETIFNTLHFTPRKGVLEKVSLHELYDFFKLLQIDYVNIFDLSCRSCKTRRLNEDEIADIGIEEYLASRSAVAFGKTRKTIKKKKREQKSNQKKRKSRKH